MQHLFDKPLRTVRTLKFPWNGSGFADHACALLRYQTKLPIVDEPEIGSSYSSQCMSGLRKEPAVKHLRTAIANHNARSV